MQRHQSVSAATRSIERDGDQGALPRPLARTIPFFCSTNVEPLTRLDTTATLKPRETAAGPGFGETPSPGAAAAPKAILMPGRRCQHQGRPAARPASFFLLFLLSRPAIRSRSEGSALNHKLLPQRWLLLLLLRSQRPLAPAVPSIKPRGLCPDSQGKWEENRVRAEDPVSALGSPSQEQAGQKTARRCE